CDEPFWPDGLLSDPGSVVLLDEATTAASWVLPRWVGSYTIWLRVHSSSTVPSVVTRATWTRTFHNPSTAPCSQSIDQRYASSSSKGVSPTDSSGRLPLTIS